MITVVQDRGALRSAVARRVVCVALSIAWGAFPAQGAEPDSTWQFELATSYPLVPWAPQTPMFSAGFDEDLPEHLQYVPTQGSWHHLLDQPRLLPRRTPGWLAWAVKDPGPQFYDPKDRHRERIDDSIPEPEITARNLPEPPPPPEPLRRNEIIVWGERLEQAHQRVAERLEKLGYKLRNKGGGRTVWAPAGRADRWKPTVIIYDEGWFIVRSSPLAFSGMSNEGAPGTPAHGGSIAPAFDRAPPAPSAGVGFAFATRRQKKAAEARIARLLHDAVSEIAAARADGWLLERLDELPQELDSIWYGGRAPDGRPLVTIRARQEAILELWASRAETRSGRTIQQGIADYLLAEVDPEAPLDRMLVLLAEERCGCVFPWPWRGAGGE